MLRLLVFVMWCIQIPILCKENTRQNPNSPDTTELFTRSQPLRENDSIFIKPERAFFNSILQKLAMDFSESLSEDARLSSGISENYSPAKIQELIPKLRVHFKNFSKPYRNQKEDIYIYGHVPFEENFWKLEPVFHIILIQEQKEKYRIAFLQQDIRSNYAAPHFEDLNGDGIDEFYYLNDMSHNGYDELNYALFKIQSGIPQVILNFPLTYSSYGGYTLFEYKFKHYPGREKMGEIKFTGVFLNNQCLRKHLKDKKIEVFERIPNSPSETVTFIYRNGKYVPQKKQPIPFQIGMDPFSLAEKIRPVEQDCMKHY